MLNWLFPKQMLIETEKYSETQREKTANIE